MEIIQSLTSMLSTLKKTNDNELDEINSLLSFIRTMTSSMISFSATIAIPLEQTNKNNSSKLSSSLSLFYSMHKTLKDNLIKTAEKINSELVMALIHYEPKLKKTFVSNAKCIDNIINNLIKEQDELCIIKNEYYKECELNSNNTLKKNLSTNNALLSKKCLLYKSKIEQVNKLLEDYEKEFIRIVTNITETEEKKILFVKEIIDKYLTYTNEINLPFTSDLTAVNSIFKKYEIYNDLISYSSKFNLISPSPGQKVPNNQLYISKWNKCEFIPYEDVCEMSLNTNEKSDENQLQLSQILLTRSRSLSEEDIEKFLNENEDKKSSNTSNKNMQFIDINSPFSPEFEVIDSPNSTEETMRSKLKIFFNQIILKEDINHKILDNVLEIIDKALTNKQGVCDFHRIFLDEYFKRNNENLVSNIFKQKEIEESKSKYFSRFQNFKNLAHFNTILINILLNLDVEQTDNFNSIEILSFILEIGEKAYYKNVYCCALMSKNNIFKNKEMWNNLIIYYTRLLLGYQIESFLQKENKTKSAGSKIHKIINKKVRNFIAENIFKQSNEELNLLNSIEGYMALGHNNKKQISNLLPKYLNSAIKKGIIHMTSYNYPQGNIHELVMELSQKYELSNSKINYYVSYINTSAYTIRKKMPEIKNTKIKNKNNDDFEEISEDDFKNLSKSYLLKREFYENKGKNYNLNVKYGTQMNTSSQKAIVLQNVFKFLPNKDKINLLVLNKEITKNIKTPAYDYLLNSTFGDLKKHLGIWHAILGTMKFKKSFSYQTLIKIVENNTAKKISNKYYNIIDLDCKRSHFKKDYEKGKQAINNILKAFVFIEQELGYFQGMNFIASFLYQLTDSEEEAFFLFLGLFKNTTFRTIFLDDMDKLKTFFYVLRRLIYLYMPEIISILNLRNICIRFFSSPWFITLFTNCYPYIDDIHSFTLIKIWDNYFLYGWDNLFVSLLTIIKYSYNDIISIHSEDLMALLVNDLCKSDIISNAKFNEFIAINKEFEVIPNIIRDLEDELTYQVQFVGKKDITDVVDKEDEET